MLECSGGVRIEDDVLVTKDGCENLTVLPTSVEEIEEVCLLDTLAPHLNLN